MSSATVLQTGYIVDRRQDYIWFIGLPFAAVAFALVSGHYLPGAALAAIALWVTIPHHFVTWLRVYGSPAEFARFRDRFVLGPLVLVGFVYALIHYAPLTLVLIVTLWDHQHSLMQQYGFSRVYDFKARAGAPSTAKFDLAFNWIFFVNMLVVSPLFSVIWVRMLHEWRVPVEAATVGLFDSGDRLRAGLSGPRRLVRAARLRALPAQIRLHVLQLLPLVFHQLQYGLSVGLRSGAPDHARHSVHRHCLLLQSPQGRTHRRRFGAVAPRGGQSQGLLADLCRLRDGFPRADRGFGA